MNINYLNSSINLYTGKKYENTSDKQNFNGSDKNYTIEQPKKMVNAQMVLANYSVKNMSFKGNIQNQQYSDEEFEIIKKSFSEVIDKIPPKEKNALKNFKRNDKQEKLAENKLFKQLLLRQTLKSIDYSNELTIDKNKCFSDKQLNNELLDKMLNLCFMYTGNEQIQLFEKVLSNKELTQDYSSSGALFDMIFISQTPVSQKFTDFIIDNPSIYKNKSFKENSEHWAMMPMLIQDEEKLNEVKEILSNEKLCSNPLFILRMISPNKEKCADDFIKMVLANDKLLDNKNFMDNSSELIDSIITEKELDFAKMIISDKKYYNNKLFMQNSGKLMKTLASDVIWYDYQEGKSKHPELKGLFFNKILNDENLFNNETFMNNASELIRALNTPEQYDIAEKIISDEKYYANNIVMENAGGIIDKMPTLYGTLEGGVLNLFCVEEKTDIVNRIFDNENLYNNETFMNNAPVIIQNVFHPSASDYTYEFVKNMISDEKLCHNKIFMDNIQNIMQQLNIPDKVSIAKKVISDEKFYGNENIMKNIGMMLYSLEFQPFCNPNGRAGIEIANEILDNDEYVKNEDFMECASCMIRKGYKSDEMKRSYDICVDERLKPYAKKIIQGEYTQEQINQILEWINNKIPENQILMLLDSTYNIEDIKKLNKTIGEEQAGKLSKDDTKLAIEFLDTYKKQNVNEIPREGKKQLLKSLLGVDGFFDISDDMTNMFPIIPTNQDDYCKLFPCVVRSLGFDTNVVLDKHFDKKLENLGNNLKKMSDEEFKNLEIKQEYSKDEFIKDVLNKIKDLPKEEQQKVYDYFGFEIYEYDVLKKDKKTKLKITTITGYPMNLNNGEKLEQIKNSQTKAVIEDLRENVVKYTKNNYITCSNKGIERDLNNIIKSLPELRPSIDCIQAGMEGTKGVHQYTVFKHSLKVMQGIVQNPEYQKLNESDKKIMLFAALLHDISKKEGVSDRSHADNSSFDAFMITKKFNLSQEEEIKLFTLIKNHEWLNVVNTANSEEERSNRIKSAAYDLRHDNMLEMSLMFTQADLNGVNDEFADLTTDENGNPHPLRTDYEGITRSFSDAANYYAYEAEVKYCDGKTGQECVLKGIKGCIEELKKTQPLLPVTKLPSASYIQSAITKVNEDGSTNIKGVYKDKDGLIILKYNELQNEDLEKIGFAKGSKTNGIDAKTSAGEDVNTGNIKFFVHGLDEPYQLKKFDAFHLINSEALLSTSYTELPESKYRFFRSQGIILDVDTKYVHGGGETDSGSGGGKFIEKFKRDYLFGAYREGDRKYISDLIKTALNMNDEEYKNFVETHKNDSLLEIDEEERNKMIRAFSEINSNERKGKRKYNEMYISNPKPVMGVFAYPEDWEEKGTNPIEFLHRNEIKQFEGHTVISRTEFLRQYALEHDIPFVVFGD